jgi:tetratricopeptide (TPR) repeat protein/tRNA A-37 threonylcarbamoyl transferase component Bud32
MPDPTRDHPLEEKPTADFPAPKSTVDDGRLAVSPGATENRPTNPFATLGYELRAEIGRGGMGVVYRARDVRMNRDVAVKLLQEHYSPKSLAARRFLDEAEITGQLQHPGIPPVHQVGELPDGRPYLVMKLIKGRTLDAILADKSVGRGALIAVFEQICQAVANAHAKGVIHRDLKPSNVMVGAFGEVQVMDWGLAKCRTDTRAESEEAVTASTFHDPRTDSDEDVQTRTGSFLGTPAYMAPEQAIGAVDQIDERSDVFGLGAVLCVILTGHPPFLGDTVESTRQLAAQQKLDDAFARLDGCGAEPELIDLCKGCLNPGKIARPPHAGEVAKAVADLRARADQRAKQAELDYVRAEGEREKAEVHASEQRKRRKVQMALAGAVLLLVMGAGAFAWWQEKQAALQKADAFRRQIQDERSRDEKREQDERNREAFVRALRRCEQALRDLDADAARPAQEEIERRMSEEGIHDLKPLVERCRTDVAMLEKLDHVEEVNLTYAGKIYFFEYQHAIDEVVTNWASAFREFGVEVGKTPLADATERITTSHIRERLLATLDRWHEWTKSDEVYALLRSVDPDPFREAVRKAIHSGGREALRALVSSPAALTQPVHFAIHLGQLRETSATRAEAILEAAWRLNPRNFSLAMALGWLYPTYIREVTSVRVGWFQAAIALRPANPTAWTSLGIALRDRGNVDGAVAALREAIRHNPNYAFAHIHLGWLLFHFKGDREGGVSHVRQAARLAPGIPMYHNDLGSLLRNTGHLDDAMTCFRKALELNPKYYFASLHLGTALRAGGDLDGAIAVFREAFRLDPQFVEPHVGVGVALHLGLGEALHARGDLAGATTAFKEAIRLAPNHAEVHNHLAWLFSVGPDGIRDGEQAVKHAINACQLTVWKNAIYVDTLAAAHAEAGDFDKAVEWQQKAIMMPDYPAGEIAGAKKRIELFRNRKPYYDPAYARPFIAPLPREVKRP